MTKELKNPVIPRGLGRKLKKEALANMTLPTRSFKVHCEFKRIETKENGDFVIEGYASTKDVDRAGEVVEPAAFADALKEYMQNPIVTYMHDWSNPIGKTVEAKIDDNGLFVRVLISKAADRVRQLIAEGILKAFSIGYEIIDEKVVENIMHIVKLRLYDIAVVSIPANQRCLFSLAKALERGSDLELTEQEMRRQITEHPEIRKEIEDDIRKQMEVQTRGHDEASCPPVKKEFSLAPLGEAIAEAGALTEKENELCDQLEEVLGEVMQLAEAGKL